MKWLLSVVVLGSTLAPSACATEPWRRHTIDDSSRGADGVRLGDADRDGRLDVVTGWEEGGQIRVCFQPESASIRSKWPSVAVANVRSPEDAVFADLNNDGWLDVVSCCEGKQQAVFVHLSPGKTQQRVRTEALWKTTEVAGARDLSRWMFCLPMSDGNLIVGSKEPKAQISLLRDAASESPTLNLLRRSGWIMSLRQFDVDGDGDHDVVYSDRKGAARGIGWLQNNGSQPWRDISIGGTGLEVMFLDIHSGADQRPEVYCDTRNGFIIRLTPGEKIDQPWKASRIPHPDGIGGGKAVAIGDLNGDGITDLAATCEHASGVVGAYWLEGPEWTFHDISGTAEGVKFDRIELIDLDGDSDLDLMTCEERDNLGVIWYENPLF